MKKPLLGSILLMLISHAGLSQAANNTCATAVPLTVNATCSPTTGNLYLADRTSPTASCGNRYDVWYYFTVPANTTYVTISVALIAPTNLATNNTYIEVFNTNNCTVNNTAFGGCNTIASARTYTNLTPGNTYYMRINTNVNPNGDPARYGFTVCLTANDDCASAVNITPGTTVASSLVGASASPVPLGCATAGAPNDDVWFRFIAAHSESTVTLSSVGSSLATAGAMVQFFSGACGSLTSLGCGNMTTRVTGLTPGDPYYIRVYSEGTSAIASNGNFSITVTPSAQTTVGSGRMKEVYEQTILSGPNILLDPWEVTYGPDNYLWVTEAKGYRVYRIHPVTGARDTIVNVSQNSTFFSSPSDQAFNMQFNIGSNNPQGGMAGMALHPKLLDPVAPENYVYLSYVHSYTGGSSPTGIFYVNRVVRFEYDPVTKKLHSPMSIIDTLPGSNDHNSQRMIIAPVNGVNYLFYASGDMGAGQFNNKDRAQRSQDPGSYEGKILRFNLTPDNDSDPYQQWIPNDNPDPQTAVWSIGIRNNQGFAYDPVSGNLYGSSHGPYSDDELNIIQRAKNYGHPIVIGYAKDDNYNGSSAGAKNTTSSCPAIISESANALAIGSSYKDPLFSAYDREASEINAIWVDAANNDNGPWPSEGWSGLDFYKGTIVPGWKNSLVVSSLKWGRILRLKLNNAADSVIETDGKDTVSYFGSRNRFRDLAFSPDGKDMFVIMDRSGTTSGPSANNPIVPACGGCLQKYTFLGYADNGGKSTIPKAIPVTAPTTINACTPATTVTISGSNNNLWVPITGPDGNIMAEIKANGQNLGTITSSFYKNGNALRQFSGKRYLDRNITITPQTQPSGDVSIRLYISKAELDAMIADPMSSIDTITDLRILKNIDACRSTIGSNTQIIVPAFAEEHGEDGYMVQADINSFSSFYFGAALITLPVEMLAFKGELVNGNTFLQWETDNEKNTLKFVVERGVDGRNFQDIGSVAAAGNSSSRLNYNFTDATLATLSSNVAYYRLRIVNIDGQYDYSNTIKITLDDPGMLTVFPNPASNTIRLSLTAPVSTPVKWTITDITGRAVLSGSGAVVKGRNVIPVSISKLAGGAYQVRLTGAGLDQTVKFRKQ